MLELLLANLFVSQKFRSDILFSQRSSVLTEFLV